MRSSDTAVTSTPTRSRKFNSLVAAAQVMRAPRAQLVEVGTASFKTEAWQESAWQFFDDVGELGFGVEWIAAAMSRVNLIAARPPSGPGDEPAPLDPDDPDLTPSQRRAIELVALMAGGPAGQGQMMHAAGEHLTVAGIGWLVAEPDLKDPESDDFVTWDIYSGENLRRTGSGIGSKDEVRVGGESSWRELHPNALVVRIWLKHPRKPWMPTSPTRRCLTTLREIELLTKHKQAAAVSRLAGSGLLIMPSEAKFPRLQSRDANADDPAVAADDEQREDTDDDFVETLVDAMVIPIGDRGAASAVVPLVVRIPGIYCDKVRHVTFSTPFDTMVQQLLDQAIKRLALQMDLPPEVLLGTADMNHWSAWKVDDSAISMHIEPRAETVCHGLTMGYLAPALQSENLVPSEAMVWYDTTDLSATPDKAKEATQAYEAGEISAEAWLQYLGLDTADAPETEERNRRILIDLAKAHAEFVPAVVKYLGIDIDLPPGVSDASAPNGPETAPESSTDDERPPDTESTPPSDDGADAPVQAAALVAACDQLVLRALERAGSRLRSAAGRKRPGGAASVACEDVTCLHVDIDATEHASLDELLAGAWGNAPAVAMRYGVAPDALVSTLDGYARGLLGARQEHSHDRLARALGVYAHA